jgi:phage tail sheath protein FI
MPVAPTYPGVYIEEVSSGVRSIAGVATSIAAFVDTFPAGPMNEAVRVLGFADFERKFGGLSTTSEASYGLQQFFLNGGSEAYVVRVTAGTGGAATAAVVLKDSAGTPAPVLVATAADAGAWGNNVRIDVDYDTTNPTTLFNLTVTEVATVNGATSVVATETYRNLVADPTKPNDAAAVVNASSQLIRLANTGSANRRPALTGTASTAAITNGVLPAVSGGTMDVVLNGGTSVQTAALTAPTATTTPAQLAASLQALLRAVQSGGNAMLPNATVSVVGSAAGNEQLVVKTGTGNPGDTLALSGTGPATGLGYTTAVANVQQYALGGANGGAQGGAATGTQPQLGSDGTWDPSANAAAIASALIGDQAAKKGMYALLDVDLFNILCIPATMNLGDTEALQVAANATALCTSERAMYIFDVPNPTGTASRDMPDAVVAWLKLHSGIRSRNAATYFPRVDIADPLNSFRLRTVAPSGTLAGVWATTDVSRGVWKAPAGIGASLAGVQKLEYALTDLENGVLNPLAINALRTFPVYGPVAWGARTLYGADQLVDAYKYLPVRRLALYIEESLYRGTQWVVFEPNDAPLWSQVRLNVGAFMHTLFRQGAFAGTTPADAYFVHCDDKTNPQADINLGIVNVIVGFAPLKPAEFVVIQIQQMAGQIAS